ncbi:MAG: hypothetical protein IKO72_08290 [Kiritimatiellae bacterium]|nr:hypothetical protein [Kiritimatiellia bacterium]
MMSSKNSIRPFVVAVGLAFVSLAYAADVTETFEEASPGAAAGAGWSGNCVVSNVAAGAYLKSPPGYPATGTHTNMLHIEGTATRTYSETGARVIDLLVMAEELPDDELPAADGDEQIKFAFDTNGCINLYHKRPDNSATWSKLSSTEYAGGTWVRVTFTFDYTNYRCQLKVDGSPYVSDYGYRTASGSETPGSWYKLANNGSSVAQVDFIGCGGVDDLVNASSDYTPAFSGETATNGIEYAWFDEKGLAWSDGSGQAPGGSGYTVKQAYDTGTDPYGADPLYVTNATYTSSNLILTFNGYGRTFAVETSGSPFTNGGESRGTPVAGTVVSNKTDNTTTWTGPFPTSADLTYYRVRNDSTPSAETVNQFAIMKITSAAENTLFALPWKSLGKNVASPAAITAANVVMTNNLINGDYLIYYDTSAAAYKGWVMTDGAWVAVAASTKVGTLTVNAADATVLSRGQAIWLVRTATADRPLSAPFYLYGQYLAGTTDASQTVPDSGLLLANPDMKATFVVSDSKFTGVANGDEIRVPSVSKNGSMKTIKRIDGEWKAEQKVTTPMTGPFGSTTTTTTTWVTDEAALTIGPGQGFMYIPASGTRTVTW